jgi:hypothetical protein
VRGPERPGGPPMVRILHLRRYRCRSCFAIITVGPLGLMRGWLFSAPAIAWALALYGLSSIAATEVRRRVSPWSIVGATSAATWASLRRWIRAVRDGRIFASVRRCPVGWRPRQVAERAAATLAALAIPSDRDPPLHHQAWHGAAQFGRAIVM